MARGEFIFILVSCWRVRIPPRASASIFLAGGAKKRTPFAMPARKSRPESQSEI